MYCQIQRVELICRVLMCNLLGLCRFRWGKMTSKVIDSLVFLRDDNALLMFYTKRIEATNMPFSSI